MLSFKEWLVEQNLNEAYKQNDKVKDTYLKEYPDDKLGNNINPRLTFKELYQSMKQGKDFYTVIGVGDSVIREHVFELMSKVFKKDYDHFYDLWLGDTSEKGLNKKISKVLNPAQKKTDAKKKEFQDYITKKTEEIFGKDYKDKISKDFKKNLDGFLDNMFK